MSSTLRASLAKAIAAERTRQDMSQEALAARLKWSRRLVSNIETGRRQVRADELAELCVALDCGLLDLLARAGSSDRRKLRLPE